MARGDAAPGGGAGAARAERGARPVNLSFPEEVRRSGAPPAAGGEDSGRPLGLLSFDVEQFDIAGEYGVEVAVERQFEIGRAGLATVLELLDRAGSPATFFVTAEFALKYPRLVRSIVERAAGGERAPHEIASHGYTHGDLAEGDLERSRTTLEEVAGVAVRGFRRARMAETDAEAVSAAGYVYNASENPVWLPGRYNNFMKPRRARVVGTRRGKLVQIPASATPLVRMPLFWLAFKNLPEWTVRLGTRWALRADGQVNTYFHPWEFTELGGFEVPRMVKKVDGKRLGARLARYIAWLKERAEMATYNRLAERVLAGR